MSADESDLLAPTLSAPPKTAPLARRVGVLGAVLAMSATAAACGETASPSDASYADATYTDGGIDAARPDAASPDAPDAGDT